MKQDIISEPDKQHLVWVFPGRLDTYLICCNLAAANPGIAKSGLESNLIELWKKRY